MSLRLASSGWAYFQDGDYLRARSAFESAEIVSESSPVPRFGKLVVDVAQQHYRRAITQLVKDRRLSRTADNIRHLRYAISQEASSGLWDALFGFL